MLPSAYAKRETDAGRRIATSLHDLSESLGHSVVVDVAYHREITDLQDDFLAQRIRDMLPVHAPRMIRCEEADICIRPVAWALCQSVFEDDFVFIGSTRMMELVNGGHDHDLSHSMRARCRRAFNRPSFADQIYHASLVNWKCLAPAARDARAKHFKKKLADAEGQLPNQLPGVIHVGMESSGQLEADLLRHSRNGREASTFKNAQSRLRW